MRQGDSWLLTTQIETVYGADPLPGDSDILAVYGWSPDADVLVLSERVNRLRPPSRSGRRFAPQIVPPALASLVTAIRRAMPELTVAVGGGPSFVFPARGPAPAGSDLPIIVSDADGRTDAHRLDRPTNWEAGEWRDLVNGDLGTWAMAIAGNAPVSICHTPASSERAAEAGVWTSPDYRGRGLAPAVTYAWWARERHVHDALFYSTSSENHASQAVAHRLQLDPIGWLWTARRN